MKYNSRGFIQEGATVRVEMLIERGSAQEVNCEQRGGKETRAVYNMPLQHSAWLNIFKRSNQADIKYAVSVSPRVLLKMC